MICANCGKEIHNGYFWEGTEVKYICTECLLSYRELKMNKYDRNQVMRMHKKGYSKQTIAAVMGTNPLTIAWIIKREEKKNVDTNQRKTAG